MSEGTPPPPPPPSDNPYGGAPPPPPGGGTPPPPAGPPGGSAPPPGPPPGQPGGYGAAPPPPPAPPLGGGAYSAPESFTYGWNKFKAKPAEMLVPILVVLVVVIVVQVILYFLMAATLLGTHDCTRTFLGEEIPAECGPGFVMRQLGSGITFLIANTIQLALGAGLIKSALNVADGKPVSLGDIGAWATKGPVIVAALIVSAATAVGIVLCFIPGIIIGFLLNWTMFYVVDKGMAPMDAVKASISFASAHLGETIVFYLLGIVVLIIGAILCLVGLLVAAPVLLIAAAYTFRKLSGEQVTPAPA